jgi:hypothetical protein
VSGLFVAGVSGSTGPIPLDCNRACLEGVIDQYLKALVAHDPKMLPLSADVKFTENGQPLPDATIAVHDLSGHGNDLTRVTLQNGKSADD